MSRCVLTLFVKEEAGVLRMITVISLFCFLFLTTTLDWVDHVFIWSYVNMVGHAYKIEMLWK